MENRFFLNSNDCEILMEFERRSSLQEMSEKLGKDISVISRNLKSISEKASVIEKQGGRWKLTSQGKALNHWTREAIFSQAQTLNKMKVIKIATTREFASRVLIPNTEALFDDSSISISLVTSDDGIEPLILSGEVDFGFDCGRPKDPLVSYKRAVKEPFSLIASPKFIRKHRIKTYEDLKLFPKLKFNRTENQVLDSEIKGRVYYGSFTDIASVRQACIQGFGWTVLPTYTVLNELNMNQLKEIDGLDIKDEIYSVWWLRERKSITPWAKKAITWLKAQDLG
ncbi:MAG: LysR family transcriptional regulator [Bdellovibrionaceae bacterium]|nr:LysR family transcriptional regulator [Pseudobdellovibrionaceae bacterium]